MTDQDATDPPNEMAADYVFSFQTVDTAVCGDPATKIGEIQGEGASAAKTGNVTVEGVVVGDFEGPTTVGLQGFYLQDAGDGNPATSDGIFVFTANNASAVTSGEVVRVTGFARERFEQTALNGTDSNTTPVTTIVHCGTTATVAPTDVTMPFASLTAPERYEGMLVRFPQSLVMSEYFNYDQFGETVIALPLGGESRPFTPTAIEAPGAPANARMDANALSRITLDDGLGVSNPNVLRHPNGNPFSLTNLFRGGDVVKNVVGVVGFDFSRYRIQPTAPAEYTQTNPRPAAPHEVGGTLRVAAQNTLNYFVTADYPTGNPLDNKCGPAQNVECRGWDFDQPDELNAAEDEADRGARRHQRRRPRAERAREHDGRRRADRPGQRHRPGPEREARRRDLRGDRHGRDRHRRDSSRADLQAREGAAGRGLQDPHLGRSTRGSSTRGAGPRWLRRSRSWPPAPASPSP